MIKCKIWNENMYEIWNVRYVGWLCLKPPLYPRLMAQKPMPSTNAKLFCKSSPLWGKALCETHDIDKRRWVFIRTMAILVLWKFRQIFSCCISITKMTGFHKQNTILRMNIVVGGVGIAFTTTNHPDVYMYKNWNWNSKTLKLEIPECLNIISIWFTLSVLPFHVFMSIIFCKDSYFLHSRIGSATFSQFQ